MGWDSCMLGRVFVNKAGGKRRATEVLVGS